MDYERTMRLFAQQIENTNKKIDTYLHNNVYTHRPLAKIEHLIINPYPKSSNAYYSQPARHPISSHRHNLKQQQVCCITVTPEKLQPIIRHKTQESSDSLVYKKPRLHSIDQSNPEVEQRSRRTSLADLGIPKRLPKVNYQQSYHNSLQRQVQLSKLQKHKNNLQKRMEDINYVSHAIDEFPFGNDHFRIMDRVMTKRDTEDKRNEMILMQFERQNQEFRKQKSTAARLLYEAKKPLINTSFISTLSNEQSRDFQFQGDTSQQIIKEESDEDTIYKCPESPVPLCQSIATVKLEPAIPIKVSASNHSPQPLMTKMDMRQQLPIIEQQIVMGTDQTNINPIQQNKKVHFTLKHPKRQLKPVTALDQKNQISSKPTTAHVQDDMVNIRKHLQLLKKRRLQRTIIKEETANSPTPNSPIAQISKMAEKITNKVQNNRSLYFINVKKANRPYRREKTGPNEQD